MAGPSQAYKSILGDTIVRGYRGRLYVCLPFPCKGGQGLLGRLSYLAPCVELSIFDPWFRYFVIPLASPFKKSTRPAGSRGHGGYGPPVGCLSPCDPAPNACPDSVNPPYRLGVWVSSRPLYYSLCKYLNHHGYGHEGPQGTAKICKYNHQ